MTVSMYHCLLGEYLKQKVIMSYIHAHKHCKTTHFLTPYAYFCATLRMLEVM